MSKEAISRNPLNRRIAPRFRTVFPVGVEYGNKAFTQSKALNLSTSGVRLVVDHAPGNGSVYELTLCLDEDHLVEVKGTAVWEERLGSFGTHVVGLTFAPGQYASRALIKDWLAKQGVAA